MYTCLIPCQWNSYLCSLDGRTLEAVNFKAQLNFVFVHNLKYLELNYYSSLSQPRDFVINAPAANISTVSRKLLKMITIFPYFIP